MFKLSQKIGLPRLSTAISAVRTFKQAQGVKPTVFEPLPSKRGGEHPVRFLHKQLIEKFDPTGKRRALVHPKTGLRAGDVINVTYMDRTTVMGQVIAIKRGQQTLGTNILIRNKLNRVGVEVRVPLYNPTIKNIEVVQKPTKYLPRRKQYYIRNTKHDVGELELSIKK